MEIGAQGTVLSKKDHTNAIDNNQGDELTSCGGSVVMCQMKIVDENNNEVGPGTVAKVIAIGVPDEKWGELVLGIVVKVPGAEVTEGELLDYCRDKLAAYQRPKRIEFCETITRTIYGKPDKKLVKKKYWEGRDRMI